MPLLNQPPTLIRICILNIVEDFAQIEKYFAERNKSLIDLRQNFAPVVCQEIIEEIAKLSKTNIDLRCFIRGGMRHLVLTRLRQTNIIPQLIALENVQTVDLSFCKLRSDELCIIFGRLKLIKELNLCATRCNDKVIKKISENCRHLTSINLKDTPVTDVGINYLCDAISICEASLPLRSIEMRNTLTTYWSIVKLLTCHSGIDSIYTTHELTTEFFEGYQMCSKEPSSVSVFYNNKISNFEHPVSLSVVNRCMPFLKHIVIYNIDNFVELRDQRILQKLQNLVFCNTLDTEINSADLNTVLEQRGHQLESLSLHKILDIDLASIGKLCPNLQTLKLARLDCRDFDFERNERNFNRLEWLEIRNVLGNFWNGWLKDLLSTCESLESLSLFALNDISDDEISWMVQKFPLNYLTCVEIVNCPSVTAASVRHLVKSRFPLRNIVYRPRHSFSYEDELEIKDYIKTKNLDVRLRIE